MGWWFEGDMGECESCHIFVIDKCIICLRIQIYNNNNNILKPCMTYNSLIVIMTKILKNNRITM